MRLAGMVVADPDTVIDDGAVVTAGDEIVFVGDREAAETEYPDHTEREFGIVAPGLVNAHVHSVQSLGRGIADDADLMTWLYDHVLPLEAAMDEPAVRTAARLGYLECIESGATTVLDHPTVNHTQAAFEAAGEVGLRARLGKVLMDRDAPERLQEDAADALAESERLIDHHHDTHGGRIRYAVTPRFAITCSAGCLRGARDLADRHEGVRLHTHASETRGEVRTIEDRHGVRNVTWLEEVGLLGPDVTLAHAVWTDEGERKVLAETDTAVVHCPSANMKLASGAAPIRDYLDRGLTVGLGNDGPPCNNTLDPFSEMRQAALLATLREQDATALTAAAAFRMATLDGARAVGFDRVGALREGWRADVIGIVTDRTRTTPIHDPVSHLVYAAHGNDVRFAMVDGTVRYADGEHADVDAGTVRTRARALADRLTR